MLTNTQIVLRRTMPMIRGYLGPKIRGSGFEIRGIVEWGSQPMLRALHINFLRDRVNFI